MTIIDGIKFKLKPFYNQPHLWRYSNFNLIDGFFNRVQLTFHFKTFEFELREINYIFDNVGELISILDGIINSNLNFKFIKIDINDNSFIIEIKNLAYPYSDEIFKHIEWKIPYEFKYLNDLDYITIETNGNVYIRDFPSTGISNEYFYKHSFLHYDGVSFTCPIKSWLEFKNFMSKKLELESHQTIDEQKLSIQDEEFTVIGKSGCYMIQLAADIGTKKVKIGKSQDLQKRLNSIEYRNARWIRVANMKRKDECEKELIRAFNLKFENVRNADDGGFGREYFIGNMNEMIKEFERICDSYSIY